MQQPADLFNIQGRVIQGFPANWEALTRRRTFLQSAAAGLTLPRRVSAASARLLKFIPQADLALLDPIQSPALVTIMHACMVFDTLYGVDATYRTQP